MSLLTPERVPVKVYRWDDEGAPALDKTSNCMATIFKACLVTGYGTKEPAGWTMPWEDTTAGVKVLRPEVSPHTDFYLRLSADTGTEMAVQVYLNMTDANTGDLKLQCDSPFKYGKNNTSGKWILIASPRGVWFTSEHAYQTNVSLNMSGSFFYCGHTTAYAQAAQTGVYLQHSGGAHVAGNTNSITGIGYQGKVFKDDGNFYLYGKCLLDNTVHTTDVVNTPNGTDVFVVDDVSWQAFAVVDEQAVLLPGLFVPWYGAQYTNFHVLVDSVGGESIVCNNSTRYACNLNVKTDHWVY